jgi:hypothetical protein
LKILLRQSVDEVLLSICFAKLYSTKKPPAITAGGFWVIWLRGQDLNL